MCRFTGFWLEEPVALVPAYPAIGLLLRAIDENWNTRAWLNVQGTVYVVGDVGLPFLRVSGEWRFDNGVVVGGELNRFAVGLRVGYVVR